MYLSDLVKSKQTVFSSSDLRKIWKISDPAYLKVLASRLFKKGQLQRLNRGIYAISDEYDIFELANKLKAPSYVSLETVLAKENIVFQDYGRTIFSVSNNSIAKEAAGKTFSYAKIADKILSNPAGIQFQNQVYVASPERAACDRIYLSPNYYFDNPGLLKPEKLKAISRIYNKRTQDEVEKILKEIYKR
jgi:predicted transcriptional regulator of viral defense system